MHGALLSLAFALLLQDGPSETSLPGKIAKQVAAVVDRLDREFEATLALKPDRSRFENGYVVTVAHYRVRCNDTYAVARLIADTLEKMRPEFQALLGEEPKGNEPMNVFVYRTIEEYNQFGTNNGAQHSSNYGGFYSTQNAERPVATYVFPNSENPVYSRLWATHGAFHQYLAAASPAALPVWLEEGLASYFELYILPNAWTDYLPGLGETWIKGPPLPISRLIHDGVEVYTPDHYKEIGAFIYYLRHLRADTSGEVFDGFVRKAMRGELVAESPVMKAISGDPDLLGKDFVQALRESKR